MLKRDTIKSLYSTDLDDVSSSTVHSEEYATTRTHSSELKELLNNCIDPAIAPILEQYIQSRTDLLEMELENTFANVFSFAFKLMVEALFGKN